MGANTFIGALTGGLVQALGGGSFSDGFTRGALGGAIVYAGKRLSVGRFAGAGWIGREVAAVGTSIVRNASDGLPTVHRLVLPLGPLRVHFRPNGDQVVNVKLDLLEAAGPRSCGGGPRSNPRSWQDILCRRTGLSRGVPRRCPRR